MSLLVIVGVVVSVVIWWTRRSPVPDLPGPMSQRWIAQFLYRDGKEQ